MAPASPQAPPPSFDKKSINNAISVDGVGSPSHVKELDYWFEEEWRGWKRIVQDLDEEFSRLNCKGEEDKGLQEDGLRIDLIGDVGINGFEGVE